MGCSASLWLASPSGRLQGQSYHNVCDSKLITHNSKLKSRKRESFTEFCFRSALSSVFIASFAFVLQMHRAMPIALFHFSVKNITHSDSEFFHLLRTIAKSDIFVLFCKALVSGTDYALGGCKLLNSMSAPARNASDSKERRIHLLGNTEHTVNET